MNCCNRVIIHRGQWAAEAFEAETQMSSFSLTSYGLRVPNMMRRVCAVTILAQIKECDDDDIANIV